MFPSWLLKTLLTHPAWDLPFHTSTRAPVVMRNPSVFPAVLPSFNQLSTISGKTSISSAAGAVFMAPTLPHLAPHVFHILGCSHDGQSSTVFWHFFVPVNCCSGSVAWCFSGSESHYLASWHVLLMGAEEVEFSLAEHLDLAVFFDEHWTSNLTGS